MRAEAPPRRVASPPFETLTMHTTADPFGGDIIEVVLSSKDVTSAGRLAEKRGDGRYMVIMQ
jgi:hypothetical protein